MNLLLKCEEIAGRMAVVAAMLVFVTGCRTPASSGDFIHRGDHPSNIDIARLNRILGITARNYKFDLRPDESLLVSVRAQKNNVDSKDDTFTREIPFAVYQQFDKNYPAFEPMENMRVIDIEILEPGHTWNPDRTKVSIRMPGFDRYFYFDKPVNSTTQFGTKPWIVRNEQNRLLDLSHRNRNGDIHTLTVHAEIRSNLKK